MALANTLTTPDLAVTIQNAGLGAASRPVGAVSWGAIFAGAAAAAVLSMILLILGVGLGLSSISPWSGEGIAASSLGWSTIIWLTATQVLASGMGGYLAGRLRTKWVSVHTDEVYFRDTAHGFLSWAVASLVTAALLGSAISSIVSGGMNAGATLAQGAATAAAGAATAGLVTAGQATTQSGTSSDSIRYLVDSLFRRDAGNTADAGNGATTDGSSPTTTAANGTGESRLPAAEAEVTRIFANAIHGRAMPAEDARYVGRMIAQRTGLSQAEAEKRVTDTYARAQANLREIESSARDATEKARKASAYAALWAFVALLAGAFVASLMATFGGRQRDEA
ncbi:MAG: hypothetical protein ABI794_15980 [Betaproteobacteria bacterium]